MGFASLAPLLLLALAGAASPTASGDIPPPLPEPIVTRQNLFAIPYHIQRPSDPTTEPAEVQLYVSADQGASWRLSSRVSPVQGQFVFRAPADGEYWFVVRTMDRAGGLRPQGIRGPELRVVVATTPPTLQLRAHRGPDGQIVAQWDVNETRLKPDSLQLQFRTGFDQSWETVAIDPRNQRISGSHVTGDVTWWPRATSGILEIRAEVADAAGNPAVSHAQVDLVDNRPPAAAIRDHGLAADVPPSRGAANILGPWREANDAMPPANQPPGDLVRRLPPVAPPTTPAPSLGFGPPTTFPTAESREVTTPARPADDSPAPPISPAASALAAALARAPAPVPAAAPVRSALPGPVAMQFSPAVEDQYSPSRATAPVAPVVASGNAMRPKMVNALEFQLEYDVSSTGASGVGRLEVWGTRDGGQNWRMYAADDSGRSPILVRVDEEGLYGFRMLARSGHDISAGPPKRGDSPDIWVGVDLTKPVGRFTRVQEGKGEQNDRLYIDWETSDRAPAAHGVTLYFSPSPAGPWTRIAGGLEPSGRYVWQLHQGLPGQLYLRLEVYDEAGNMAAIDDPDPVELECVRPLARIRDVRPLN
jgi:hypothetical protein